MLAAQRVSMVPQAQMQRQQMGAVRVRPEVAPRAVATRRSSASAASTSSVDFEASPVAKPVAPAAPAAKGGHKGSTGPFAPLVVATRTVVGEKEFNKFRGKAISLHSQVIKEFGKVFGVESRQTQGLVRLAKKNGEWLGFLA